MRWALNGEPAGDTLYQPVVNKETSMYTYLASPYTHDDPDIRQRRYQDIMRVAAVFILREEVVYSPVIHFHPLSIKYGLPLNFTFWERHLFSMLRQAKDFVLVKLDGWETSNGMREEYEFAKSRNLPIFISKSGEDYKIPLEEEPW